MNKRLIAFLSILSLSVSLPLIPASAAAKAGAKCTKAGGTEVVKGKIYTCVKAGKKLAWNKGVKTSPTPTPKISFVPWSTNLNQEILLSQASSQFSKWVLGDHGNAITPTFFVDPKLDGVDISWIKDSSYLAIKAFGADSPSVYSVIVGRDCQWIRSAGSAPCTDSSNNQYYSNSTSKSFFVLQSVSEKNKLRASDFQSAAHEYFHSIQAKLSNGASWPTRVPSWFIEGGAYFIGISFNDLSGVSTYIEGRNEEVLQRGYQNRNYLPLEKYTYLNFTPPSNYENPYGIGCIATEFIVASVGMEKYLDIYRSLGSGKDFNSSFETATGMPLTDFYTKFEIIRDKVGMPHGQ